MQQQLLNTAQFNSVGGSYEKERKKMFQPTETGGRIFAKKNVII